MKPEQYTQNILHAIQLLTFALDSVPQHYDFTHLQFYGDGSSERHHRVLDDPTVWNSLYDLVKHLNKVLYRNE